jgi:hypothetical protein
MLLLIQVHVSIMTIINNIIIVCSYILLCEDEFIFKT